MCVVISHSKSVFTVQRAFRAKYAKVLPTGKTIHAWYIQLTEIGCLCKQKSSGRPLTAEDDVEQFRFSMCAPVVQTLNISSCQKKNCFSFPVAVNNSIKVGPLVFLL